MTINQLLLQLENTGYDKDIIRQLYGLFHTIKGTAAVLGIDPISNLAHSMEDLLDVFQEKENTLDKNTLDLLFKSSDSIEVMLKDLADNGQVEYDPKEIIKQLNKILNEYTKNDSKKGNNPKNEEQKDELALTPDQKGLVMEALTENKNIFELEISMEEDMKFKAGRIFQFQKALSLNGYVIASVPDFENIEDSVNEIKILYATDNEMDNLAELSWATYYQMGTSGDTLGFFDKAIARAEEVGNKAAMSIILTRKGLCLWGICGEYYLKRHGNL